MKYAEVAAYRFGVDVTYLPPDYQSLSQCETAIQPFTGLVTKHGLTSGCFKSIVSSRNRRMIYAWSNRLCINVYVLN